LLTEKIEMVLRDKEEFIYRLKERKEMKQEDEKKLIEQN
jgi:hypothetical protein